MSVQGKYLLYSIWFYKKQFNFFSRSLNFQKPTTIFNPFLLKPLKIWVHTVFYKGVSYKSILSVKVSVAKLNYDLLCKSVFFLQKISAYDKPRK